MALIHHDVMLQEATHISALPVCDGERFVGLPTDRDITIRTIAEGNDLKATKL